MAILSGSLPSDSYAGTYVSAHVPNQSPTFGNIAFIAVLPIISKRVFPAMHIPLSNTCEEVVITITVLDHNTIRVTFSQGVINNRALLDPLNYIFTPSLIVCSVTANDPSVVSYVDLEVAGMTNQGYSLTIQTVEAA